MTDFGYFSQNGVRAVTPAMYKFQLIALKANLLELGPQSIVTVRGSTFLGPYR